MTDHVKRKLIQKSFATATGLALVAKGIHGQEASSVCNIIEIAGYSNPATSPSQINCHSCAHHSEGKCSKWQITTSKDAGCDNGEPTGKYGFIERSLGYQRPLSKHPSSLSCADGCIHQVANRCQRAKALERVHYGEGNIDLLADHSVNCHHNTPLVGQERSYFNKSAQYATPSKFADRCRNCRHYNDADASCSQVTSMALKYDRTTHDTKVTPESGCVLFVS
ncbi:MAG: hypothetical protein VXY77_00380 [Pseudomonadota bacterium]|nr:hypothetical protein [Pseudomonadota bacterium]